MKINKLELKNFRGVTNFTLSAPEKVTAILGPTGAGKTSIIKAVEFALVNPTRKDTTLKKNGEKSMEVYLETPEMSILGAQKTKNVSIGNGLREDRDVNSFKLNGRNATRKGINEELGFQYGIKPEAVLNSISIAELSSMDSGELSAFLLSYINDQMDADRVLGFIPNASSEVKTELGLRLPFMPEKFGVNVLKEIRTDIEEERKLTKKQLFKYELNTQNEIPAPTKSQNEVERAYEDVIMRLGKADSIKSAHEKWKKECADYKAAKKRIDELEQRYKSMTLITKPNEALNQKNKDELEELTEKVSMENGVILVLENNIKQDNEMLGKLSSNRCILGDFPCTTDRTTIIEDVKKKIASNKEAIDTQKKLVEQDNDRMAFIKKSMAAYEESRNLYNEKIKLLTQIQALKDALKPLAAEPAKPQSDETLNREKMMLQNELKEIKAYEKYLEDVRARESLKKQTEILEECVALLKDKGIIMDKVNEYYLSVFNDILKKRTDLLNTGIGVFLVNESGIKIMVTKDSIVRKIDDCSDGEKAIVYFILADMINQLSGFDIIFFDNIDKLDVGILKQLIALVQSKEVTDQYDHIFLLGIDHEDTVKAMQDAKVSLLTL